MTDRTDKNDDAHPFKRLSNSLFSELSQSQLSSARELPDMKNEYLLAKMRESKQFFRKVPEESLLEDKETAS